jgi:hypothetical protein
MKKIPPNRVRSHADFDLTELGKWATGNDATGLTARGQRVQRPYLALPSKPISIRCTSVKFEEAVALRTRTSRRRRPPRSANKNRWARLEILVRIGASSKSIFLKR